ncbi:MAG: hypothetical protein ACI4QT_10745, partial [Kiritimatiellia bacterium]
VFLREVQRIQIQRCASKWGASPVPASRLFPEFPKPSFPRGKIQAAGDAIAQSSSSFMCQT